VASPGRKPTREAKGSADQSMKKTILVSLILLEHPLKASMNCLLVQLIPKKILTAVPCRPKFN